MNRQKRLALAAAAVLLLVVTGTAFATRQPQGADEPAQLTASQEAEADDGPPTADELAHAADRLGLNEITVTDDVLADLAGRYGVGGAVRLLAWADSTGMSVDELAAMRDGDGSDGSGMGWGQIAKELGVHPGIGSIMGNGGGHGRDDAPGQQKDRGADEDTESGE